MDKSTISEVVKGISTTIWITGAFEVLSAMVGIQMPITRLIASKHQENVNEQRLRDKELDIRMKELENTTY